MTTDYMNQPAGSIPEPSYPLLSAGQRAMIIRSVEVKENDKNEKRLETKLELQKQDKDQDGKILHPGFSFNNTTFLTPNQYNTQETIAQELASILRAALGKNNNTTPKQFLDNPSMLNGKVVEVKVGIKKSKDPQYEDRNIVKQWLVPA